MSRVSAVLLDYIGTLVTPRGYTMEDSVNKLCAEIISAGFEVEEAEFLERYGVYHEKYRAVRYGENVEVTNAVWICEALNSLGHFVEPEDARLSLALDNFFNDYVMSLEPSPRVEEFLSQVSKNYSLGLVSNFTYSPVVHQSLNKLNLKKHFRVVRVSHDVGWRKPDRRIFEATLEGLGVASEEAVFVGDSPLEDIAGAQQMGMKTVFVPSQFYSLADLQASRKVPDLVASDFSDVYAYLLRLAD